MKSGITKGMKTAISVDEDLMEQADDAAHELGLSRSGLISAALREYLQRRRQAHVSSQLNQAYANEPNVNGRRLVRKLRTKVPALDRW